MKPYCYKGGIYVPLYPALGLVAVCSSTGVFGHVSTVFLKTYTYTEGD